MELLFNQPVRERDSAIRFSHLAARSIGPRVSSLKRTSARGIGAADQFIPLAGQVGPIGAAAVQVGWNCPIILF